MFCSVIRFSNEELETIHLRISPYRLVPLGSTLRFEIPAGHSLLASKIPAIYTNYPPNGKDFDRNIFYEYRSA